MNRVREASAEHHGAPAATDDPARTARGPPERPARVWDEEHDRHVAPPLARPGRGGVPPGDLAGLRAGPRRAAAEAVAAELHTSVNAVLIAKLRVLHRLRARAAGLIDGTGHPFS